MHLVTGGAGFIGSNIVRGLNDRGEGGDDVLVVDVLPEDDCPNLDGLKYSRYVPLDEFRRELAAGTALDGIDCVLHQGACADTMVADRDFMMDRNFEFSRELLDAALGCAVAFVYASSASVYGNGTASAETPENEDPLNIYAESKLRFDEHVRGILDEAATTVVGLRYFNVYGPRERHKGRMASMPYQLYRQLAETGIARLFAGTDGYEAGEQRRDFVYAGDCVDVNLFFAGSEAAKGVFNVGTGRSRSFNEVAGTIIELIGRGHIEYMAFPEELVGKYQSFTEADISALRRAGYAKPFTSLEDGLAASAKDWRLG